MLLRDPDPDLDRHAESLRGLLTTAYLVHTAMGAYLAPGATLDASATLAGDGGKGEAAAFCP